MCIGTPMQIIESRGFQGKCLNKDQIEYIDLSLVGEQPEGTWIMVFLGAARSIIDAHEASQISNALDALEAVSRGESVEHFFADLINREPQLPDFLQEQHQQNSKGKQKNG